MIAQQRMQFRNLGPVSGYQQMVQICLIKLNRPFSLQIFSCPELTYLINGAQLAT